MTVADPLHMLIPRYSLLLTGKARDTDSPHCKLDTITNRVDAGNRALVTAVVFYIDGSRQTA